jgi:hypothetical protein
MAKQMKLMLPQRQTPIMLESLAGAFLGLRFKDVTVAFGAAMALAICGAGYRSLGVI